MLEFDVGLFLEMFEHMRDRVGYCLGGKVKALSEDSALITCLDCSGALQYWLYRAGQVTIPEGSVEQQEVLARRLSPCSYRHAIVDVSGAWFVCFIQPGFAGHKYGHTFLMQLGDSYECYDPDGVGSRVVESTSVLVGAPVRCYLLKLGADGA